MQSAEDPLWTEFYKVQKGVHLKLSMKSNPILMFGQAPPKSDGMIDYDDESPIFSPLYGMCRFMDDFFTKNNAEILKNKQSFYTRLFHRILIINHLMNPKINCILKMN